ncbi:MAG: DUF1614 domain-containing protein [Methanocorpusculum sp.]|nr:DUF1614 domain-containing protein [Methanocorpusculum sp.]
MTRLIFSPVSVWVFIALILLIIIGLPLLFFGVIGAALANLGFGFWVIVLLIICAIVGSFINIPLTTLHGKQKKAEPESIPRKPSGQYAPSMYDKMYKTDRFVVDEPAAQQNSKTRLTINLGGALIPILISAYIIFMGIAGKITPDPLYIVKIIAAVIIVSVVAYVTAKPVRGIGIAVPFFIPALTSIIIALILGGGFGIAAAGIGYVAGTLGTLIGADILHLKDVASENTPMMSIGGAGTFDGIFLTGIITALLAAF